MLMFSAMFSVMPTFNHQLRHSLAPPHAATHALHPLAPTVLRHHPALRRFAPLLSAPRLRYHCVAHHYCLLTLLLTVASLLLFAITPTVAVPPATTTISSSSLSLPACRHPAARRYALRTSMFTATLPLPLALVPTICASAAVRRLTRIFRCHTLAAPPCLYSAI